MNIFTLDNYQLMSAKAADLVMELIADKPDCVLALPTGKTPLGLYQELVEEYKQGELSFKQVTTFNLDDYVGVPKDHLASFYNYMQKNLFSKIDLPASSIYMLDGTANDLDWVCEDYERSIKEVGGLDLAILGIGLDGHIAYNEPGSHLETRTRVVDLTDSSRDAAQDFTDIKQAPKQGITMGVATIMEAKQIILLASGAKKKDIIKQALQGPISAKVPASFLQNHPNLIVILDKEASSQELEA